jgi:DNA-binding NtrC family response regulator
LLIRGSHSEEQSNVWAKFANAAVIPIPSLAEREEDFLPLIQRFLVEARQLGPTNKIEISAELVDQLASWPWPENVRELRACLMELALTPATVLGDWLGLPNLSFTDSSAVLSCIQELKSVHSRSLNMGSEIPSPIRARAELDKACGNIRIAASCLGVGVPQIKAALADYKFQSQSRGNL